jgi:hypothetical protein
MLAPPSGAAGAARPKRIRMTAQDSTWKCALKRRLGLLGVTLVVIAVGCTPGSGCSSSLSAGPQAGQQTTPASSGTTPTGDRTAVAPPTTNRTGTRTAANPSARPTTSTSAPRSAPRSAPPSTTGTTKQNPTLIVVNRPAAVPRVMASPPAANLDPDNDFLPNSEEARFGSNPNVADTDGDGVPDGEEVLIDGTSPTNPDTDGDGANDLQELQNGTDAKNSDTDSDGVVMATSSTSTAPTHSILTPTATKCSTSALIYWMRTALAAAHSTPTATVSPTTTKTTTDSIQTIRTHGRPSAPNHGPR